MRNQVEFEYLGKELQSGYYSKYVGEAKLVTPSDVTSKLSDYNTSSYINGSIFVECPELGYTGQNLIYCRYGLSIPFYQVKVGDKLWIEPTIGDTERWIYSGFVDCGRSSVDPTAETDTQAIFENENGFYEIRVGSNYKVTLDTGAQTITITDGTNTVLVDEGNSKVQINGTNLEVLA